MHEQRFVYQLGLTAAVGRISVARVIPKCCDQFLPKTGYRVTRITPRRKSILICQTISDASATALHRWQTFEFEPDFFFLFHRLYCKHRTKSSHPVNK